jgi:hypothetical protein
MCFDFQNHLNLEKNPVKFCIDCASKGKAASEVFFCAICNKPKYNEHKDHANLKNFSK